MESINISWILSPEQRKYGFKLTQFNRTVSLYIGKKIIAQFFTDSLRVTAINAAAEAYKSELPIPPVTEVPF